MELYIYDSTLYEVKSIFAVENEIQCHFEKQNIV